MTARCVFFNNIKFLPKEYGWVTHPHPVLAMITQGEGKITIAHKKKTIIVKELMDPCLLPAYTMRQPAATTDQPFNILALGFSVDILGGISLLNFYDIPITYSGADRERLRDLMLRLFELGPGIEVKNLEHLAGQKNILFEIFRILIREARPKKEGFLLNTEEYGCLPAVEHLKEHFAEPFDMRKLQSMCHFSQAHFFRLFKKLTGVAPFTYLKDRRVEEAQKLLLSTSHSVSEIGERVGWHDQFHFSRIFKSRTGYSPRQFKEQYQPGVNK